MDEMSCILAVADEIQIQKAEYLQRARAWLQ